MVDRMNGRAHRRMIAALLLLTFAGTATAQTVRDPTRPPGRMAKSEPASTGGFVLQSILNAPDRKAAVINGKVVGPGESVDGFMLIGIAENEAVLKNGSDVRRLRLYPSVAVKHQKKQPEETSGAGQDK